MIYIDKIETVFQDLYNKNPYYKYLKVHYIDIRTFNNICAPFLYYTYIKDYINN